MYRQATGFGIEDVAAFFTDDGLSRLRVQPTGNGIGHGRGGQEDAGLLAEQSGDLGLQGVGGRIFAALLIADYRLGHGLPHAGRWLGYCVTIEIDHDSWSPALQS
jgi:hypothetical protein